MIRHIAVGYDFSEFADDAFGWAVDLAKATGAALTIVHVHRLDEGSAGFESLRAKLEAIAAEVGPEVRTATVHSHNVAAALVEFTEQNAVDLIVVATRGLRGVERLLLGSTADAVIKLARVPVVTLRGEG